VCPGSPTTVRAVGWLRRVVRSAITVDRAAIAIVGPVRVGVLITAVLCIGIATGGVGVWIPVALAFLLVAIADPGRGDADRLRVMLWTTVWGAAAALLAGAVSSSVVVVTLVAIPVALVCGFAGTFGPRGGVIGMLTLVVYSIFAGTPTAMDATLRDALLYLAGGVVVTFAALAPWALHRARGSRAAIALFHRGIADLPDNSAASIGSVVHAARVRDILLTLHADHPRPEVRAWLDALHEDARTIRVALLGLVPATASEDPAVERALDAFVTATRMLCGRVAAGVTWRVRRGGIPQARAVLAGALDELGAVASDEVVALATTLADALDRTATAICSPWPIRAIDRAGGPEPLPSLHTRAVDERRRVADHLRMSDPYLRHAIRLAVVFAVGEIAAHAIGAPHAYWIPMTVAWVSRPALGDTTVRVTARLIGTIVGVCASALAVQVLLGHDAALAIAVGVAGALALAMLTANYAVAVTGITIFVFTLFTLAGEVVTSSFPARIEATLIAGVLILAGAFIWPTRTGGRLAGSLAAYARALARYSEPALRGDASWGDGGRDAAAGAVLDARTTAAADFSEAEYELGGHRLDPQHGHAVLEALHAATFQSLLRDLEGASADDREAAGPVVTELTDLDARLSAADAGSGVPPRSHPDAHPHPIHRTLRRAHVVLDEGVRPQAGSTATRVSE